MTSDEKNKLRRWKKNIGTLGDKKFYCVTVGELWLQVRETPCNHGLTKLKGFFSHVIRLLEVGCCWHCFSGSVTESLGLYDSLCLSSWHRMAALAPNSVLMFKAGEGKGRCQPHLFLLSRKQKFYQKPSVYFCLHPFIIWPPLSGKEVGKVGISLFHPLKYMMTRERGLGMDIALTNQGPGTRSLHSSPSAFFLYCCFSPLFPPPEFTNLSYAFNYW